jgi:hypothetical protein
MARNWDEKKYDYDYPDGLDLSPGSELHGKLLKAMHDKIKVGRQTGQKGRERGSELDNVLEHFVPTSEREQYLKMRTSKNPAAPLDIIIPVSKAALDTWITYMAGAYLGSPSGLYALQGRGGPRGMVRAALHERFLNTQSIWFNHDLKHMTFWRDCFTYGLGCIAPRWGKHLRREPVVEEMSEVLYWMAKQLTPGVKEGDIVRYLEERIVHEGNDLINVDYYNLILDPNITVNEYEKFEYAGWGEHTNTLDLLRLEDDPENFLFNCKYLREYVRNGSGRSRFLADARDHDVADWSESTGNNDNSAVDVIHLYWKLIPKEWELGDSDKVETHLFSIGADEVIVGWQKLDYNHNMLPMLFGAPNTNGYDTFPVSGLASTYGAQAYCDWKLRAQVANQSKTLNDMLLFDPSIFEEDDLLNPEPGKLIRTKRNMYGIGGLDQFVKQLNVSNHTANNMQDVEHMMQIMFNILGTTDIVMGNLSNMPDRPTKGGLQAAQNQALSRLQKDAQMITSQLWYKLIHQMASNTTQFMSQDIMLSIVGTRYEKDIRRELGLNENETEVSLTPWDLDLNFDVMPINRMQNDGDLSAMAGFIERIISVPDLAIGALSGFDLPGLLTAYVRRAGFPNVHEYVKAGNELPQVNPQVVPDEQVVGAMDSGGVVPVQEAFA